MADKRSYEDYTETELEDEIERLRDRRRDDPSHREEHAYQAKLAGAWLGARRNERGYRKPRR